MAQQRKKNHFFDDEKLAQAANDLFIFFSLDEEVEEEKGNQHDYIVDVNN